MKFIWPDSTRNELRSVERQTAIRILHALTEYGDSGAGDVKMLTGHWQGHFRLQVGDYRVIFTIAKGRDHDRQNSAPVRILSLAKFG